MDFKKRINREIRNIKKEKIDGLEIIPSEDDLRFFKVIADGPSGTPYEDGRFEYHIFITETYPQTPPKAQFITKIYHPNINKRKICLDKLKKGGWTPATTIQGIAITIMNLLENPNLDDPLNDVAANHWKTNPEDAEKFAREQTKKFALPKIKKEEQKKEQKEEKKDESKEEQKEEQKDESKEEKKIDLEKANLSNELLNIVKNLDPSKYLKNENEKEKTPTVNIRVNKTSKKSNKSRRKKIFKAISV